MDTRSGEFISAVIGIILGITALLNPESFMYMLLARADAFPEWAILSVTCSLVCLIGVFSCSESLRKLSRFLSGCVYGTVILLSASIDYFGALFWVGLLLFAFDIVAVLTDGRVTWTLGSRS